jgi:hypothetical protein
MEQDNIKVKFTILYKNGLEDEVTRELPKGKIDEIGKFFHDSFKSGLDAVIGLNKHKEAFLIRVIDVLRVKIEML